MSQDRLNGLVTLVIEIEEYENVNYENIVKCVVIAVTSVLEKNMNFIVVYYLVGISPMFTFIKHLWLYSKY